MDQKKEKIAAVVVTYNRKDLLRRCLNGLLNQNYKLDSIIIVDNASTAQTEEMLKKEFLNNPVFDYVKLEENFGGAGGFYYGVKRAYERAFDWIWLMDDDAWPMPDALQSMLDSKVINDKNVLALCCAVLYPNGDVMLHHRRKFDWKNLSEYLVPIDKYNLPYFEIDIGSFVGLLLKRDVIDKVGFPKKELFIYHDDVEYSLRIRKIGKIYTIPDSKIVHNISISAQRWEKLVDKPAIKDRIGLLFQPFSWKDYYLNRNIIYLYLHCQLSDQKMSYVWAYIKCIRMLLIGIIRIILSNQSRRVYYIYILFKSIFDGIQGKIGKVAHLP